MPYMLSDTYNGEVANIQDTIAKIIEKSGKNNKKNASILTEYATIIITGEDREKFLQGQISANMTELLPLSCKLALACDYKGRMYTTFRIINDGEKYFLIMHKSLTEDTITSLNKYTPFFKVKLELSQYIAIGFIGANMQDAVCKSLEINSLPDTNKVQINKNLIIFKINDSFQCLLSVNLLPNYATSLAENCSVDSGNKWCLNNIVNVIPELRSEIAYKYIPQHLNQPSIAAVSFRKGCFTGQEIITRMQNLGSLNRKTYHITTEAEISINESLFNIDGKIIGNIIQVELNSENNLYNALAVIKLDDKKKAFIDIAAKQSVTIHKIPYHIDAKAELKQ